MDTLVSAPPVRATVFAIAQLAAAGSLAIGQQPSAFPAEVDSAVVKMHAAMRAQSYQDPDAAFVAMMIPHHQGAIDMAKAELKYGHNEQLRRIAQEIFVTQQQEIPVMRLAVGEELPPSAASPTQPGAMSSPTGSHEATPHSMNMKSMNVK